MIGNPKVNPPMSPFFKGGFKIATYLRISSYYLMDVPHFSKSSLIVKIGVPWIASHEAKVWRRVREGEFRGCEFSWRLATPFLWGRFHHPKHALAQSIEIKGFGQNPFKTVSLKIGKNRIVGKTAGYNRFDIG